MARTTKELRELYTEKKTTYKNSLERSNLAKEHISEIFSGIDTKFIDDLNVNNGIDLSILKTLDLERLQTDADYMQIVQETLDSGINQLRTFIERSLDV